MEYTAIKFDVTDGLGVITLNRPERLNSFNHPLKAELTHCVSSANEQDSGIRALLITGEGRGFCAGADLNPPNDGTPWDVEGDLRTTYEPMMLAIKNCRLPIVIAVNGVAAGAGCSLALAGDIVIAAESASFLQAFVNLGLVPDAGSSYFLPRLAGTARAKAMMLLGEKIPATTAEDWGLIYKTVPDDELMSTAMAIATKFATGPTVAYSGIKKLANDSEQNNFEQQLDVEATIQGTCSHTADFMEGATAFLTKRKANFKGK